MVEKIKCQWAEVKDKPGFQWCPICKRGRGYPGFQTKPLALDTCPSRLCTGLPEHEADQQRETPLDAPGYKPGMSTGFGDTVAKGINKATFGLIQPCGGCTDRKDALNYAFPYKTKQD